MGKRIEETDGALHDFADSLFNRIKELSDSEPLFYRSNGWYKFTDKTIFLIARINGNPTRAKGCQPNSIQLQAWWDDRWKDEDEVTKNPKAFWGNQPAAEVCYPALPNMKEKAFKFVEKALDLHRQRRKK